MTRALFGFILAALLTLMGQARAEITGIPPAGDNPTPSGWLLVKDSLQIIIEPSGGTERFFYPTPSPGGTPNIYGNYDGYQAWASKVDPRFRLASGGFRQFTEHNLYPEVNAGLDQVFLTEGAKTGSYPNEILEFTYHEGV